MNALLQEILERRLDRLGDYRQLFPAPGGGYLDYGNWAERVWRKVVEGLVKEK